MESFLRNEIGGKNMKKAICNAYGWSNDTDWLQAVVLTTVLMEELKNQKIIHLLWELIKS